MGRREREKGRTRREEGKGVEKIGEKMREKWKKSRRRLYGRRRCSVDPSLPLFPLKKS